MRPGRAQLARHDGFLVAEKKVQLSCGILLHSFAEGVHECADYPTAR